MSDLSSILRTMQILDYDNVYNFWTKVDGISSHVMDTREGIAKFLERNPNLSLVLELEGHIIGTALVSHDARNGYIWHFAIDSKYQKKGLGKKLEAEALKRLKNEGILYCYAFAFSDNKSIDFWKAQKWEIYDELLFMRKKTE